MIAEIVSLSRYESQVEKLMDEEERSTMEFFIANAPEDHPVIPGTGGFRKARQHRRGQSKSGGFRVIFARSENRLDPQPTRRFGEASGGDQERSESWSMTKKLRKEKPAVGKRTELGLDLEESGEEILAHLRGEVYLPLKRVVLPDEIDVESIRGKTGMSPGEFARSFCACCDERRVCGHGQAGGPPAATSGRSRVRSRR